MKMSCESQGTRGENMPWLKKKQNSLILSRGGLRKYIQAGRYKFLPKAITKERNLFSEF